MNKPDKMNRLRYCIALFLTLAFGISYAVVNGMSCKYSWSISSNQDIVNKYSLPTSSNQDKVNTYSGSTSSNKCMVNDYSIPFSRYQSIVDTSETISWVVENKDNKKIVRFIKPEISVINAHAASISPLIKVDGTYKIADVEAAIAQMMAIKVNSDTNSGETFTVQKDHSQDSTSKKYHILYPAIHDITNPNVANTDSNKIKRLYEVIYDGTYKVKMDGDNLDKLTFSLSNKEYTGYDNPPVNIIYEIDFKNEKARRIYQFFGYYGKVHDPIVDEIDLQCSPM